MATPNKRITGNPGAIPQPFEIRYDPRTGGTTESKWRGPYNYLLPIKLNLDANGWTTHLSSPNNGASWQLDATIAAIFSSITGILDNPVDQWELTSNKVEVDFLNAQSPLVNSLTAGDIFLLSNFISQQVDVGDVTWLSTGVPTLPNYNLGAAGVYTLSSNGETALALILSGVKSFPVFQPVLRQTRTTSNIYAIAASTANVNSIFSTAEVTSLINVPVAFAVPPDPIYGKLGFAYGWQKDFPNVVSAAGVKTQIITEYEFGLWNTSMYVFV